MLDKDLIPQSHLWTMGLLIGKKNIDAAFFPPVDTDDVVYRSIPLDPVAPSPLKAIEDAIYDNPLLLNPYRSIFVEIDTDSFVILPADLGDSASALAPRAIRQTTATDEPAGDIMLRSTVGSEATLFFEMEAPLVGFLRRTFFNVDLTHPLAPVASWCLTRNIPEGELTACLRDNRIDLVASKSGCLLLANTFTFDALADAAYYTLAVRSLMQFSASAHIVTAGNPTLRNEFQRLIAQAAPSLPAPVAAVLPPMMMRRGSAVASVPISLILKSLK